MFKGFLSFFKGLVKSFLSFLKAFVRVSYPIQRPLKGSLVDFDRESFDRLKGFSRGSYPSFKVVLKGVAILFKGLL